MPVFTQKKRLRPDIVYGTTDSLFSRAADVTLKERRGIVISCARRLCM